MVSDTKKVPSCNVKRAAGRESVVDRLVRKGDSRGTGDGSDTEEETREHSSSSSSIARRQSLTCLSSAVFVVVSTILYRSLY